MKDQGEAGGQAHGVSLGVGKITRTDATAASRSKGAFS